MPPNGLELSCPAEAGIPLPILAHDGWPDAPPYAPARRVSFSELLGGSGVRYEPIHSSPRMSDHEILIVIVSPGPTGRACV